MEIEYLHKDETQKIIGLCYEVHNNLGKGLLEIVYKDALQYEFELNNIIYEREKECLVVYKGKILQHKFYADFVVANKVILEVKSVSNIVDQYYSQVINYLRISKLRIGLVVNSGSDSVQIKRIVL
ncbi:MAG TPA: GxxExxY protein [Ignavibacteria bacterium]|nr:GxxExxY protein [Ignavibacteria bacterium]